MNKLVRCGQWAAGAVAMILVLAGAAWADDVAKQAMPQDGIILVAVVKAKAGQEEAVKAVLTELVGSTRKEPGCLCYNLHQSKSDKATFMFYEQWANQAALDAHAKMPYMKALGGKLKDKTDKGGGVTFYELLK